MYWCFWPNGSELIVGTAHVGDAVNHEPSGDTNDKRPADPSRALLRLPREQIQKRLPELLSG